MNTIEKFIAKTAIATDNIPCSKSSELIREERASLLLLDLFLGKHQGRYMNYASYCYNCNTAVKNGTTFTRFIIDTQQKDVIQPLYSGKDKGSIKVESHSLFSLLQKEAVYKGLDATEYFFGITVGQAFAPFQLNGRHFTMKPFTKDCYLRAICENSMYEVNLQNALCKWWDHRFPINILEGSVSGIEEHPAGNLLQIFDFADACGTVKIKAVKIYLNSGKGTLTKAYLPLTRWYWEGMNHNFIATVGLPGKQILMHLPQIAKAKTVVLCQTMEDAVALQRDTPTDEIAFTAFISGDINCTNIDFAPLLGKNIKILISNSDSISLAEAYKDAEWLYHCLRNEESFSEISFIQREVVFPLYSNVFDLEDLVAAHRSQKPVVIEESVQEFSETEFLERLENAQAEIVRKAEQNKDFPFWKKSRSEATSLTTQNKGKISDKMILRPLVVRGTTILIESTPGRGKSCFATALCARIAGSNAPFLEERCFIRCPTPDDRGNKVAYLVFDADGDSAITEHRNDFAQNIGENDINFIQLNMAGKSIDYSKEANYNDFVELISDIRDNHGVSGQPVDVLVIDTLLAFTHNKSNASFEIFTRLNQEFPDMSLIVIHHLNLNNNTYGGTLATMGPRGIIKLFRTNEQIENLDGRNPTLADPFTIKLDKFNGNKIPEDGECFDVVLDDDNHFAVVNPVRSQKEMQELLLSQYKKYYKLTQDEIGKLFDVSGRTIRNWLDEKGD